MSGVATAASSLATSLRRYQRSTGLWLLIIAAPIAARYMIPMGPGAEGVRILIESHLPLMTSGFLGVSLGIVVSTLVLPIAWLYLRSNTTRRQPWQVEEVTAASRVGIALGRFAADAMVLMAMLAALTLSGFFLGWLILPAGTLNLVEIAGPLWVVAAPALLGVAALRILFDALPPMRGALGDVVFFIVWLTSIALPAITAEQERSFAANIVDFAGFATPLIAGAPAGMNDFTIGSSEIVPGIVQLDVFGALFSSGYLESRLAWAGIAVAIAALAGLLYAPHRSRKRVGAGGRLSAMLSKPPRRIDTGAPAAGHALVGSLGLLIEEMRLIGSGWAFPLLALAAAVVSGVMPDFRHGGSAAALLVLAFALSAHAGRSEARGLVALTKVASHGPMVRRVAFVIAGAAWAVLLGLPALLHHAPLDVLTLAAGTGAAAAVIAIGLSALSGSAFAARLVLLTVWYVYLSSS